MLIHLLQIQFLKKVVLIEDSTISLAIPLWNCFKATSLTFPLLSCLNHSHSYFLCEVGSNNFTCGAFVELFSNNFTDILFSFTHVICTFRDPDHFLSKLKFFMKNGFFWMLKYCIRNSLFLGCRIILQNLSYPTITVFFFNMQMVLVSV